MTNQPDQPHPAEDLPRGYTPPSQVLPGYFSAPTPPPSDEEAPRPVPPSATSQAAAPPSAPPYVQAPPPPVAQYGPQSYGPPQYGPPSYGAPVPGQPMFYQAPPVPVGRRGLSLASMILGLTSLIFVGWFMVPQIVGIVLGHLGLRRENPQGKPFAITGLITNYLALLIYGAMYAFFIIGFAAMGMDTYDDSYASGAR